MTALPNPMSQSFAYTALTGDGQALRGTIEAASMDDALAKLGATGLRELRVEPEAGTRAKAFRGDEFLAFNQQLANLTAAGMPVERGLRLIAQDIDSKRLRKTIEELAEELDRGTPIDVALEKFNGRFPSLYGKLVSAGVRSNNLSGMLLSLGRHLELVSRLRATLWRTLAYPLTVFAGVVVVLLFISVFIMPQFVRLYAGFNFEQENPPQRHYLSFTHTHHLNLPWPTEMLIFICSITPAVSLILLLAVVAGIIVWRIAKSGGKENALAEAVLFPMPLIGPVLKRNAVARWVDALGLAVRAGLDLPAAISLASEAVASPRLLHDGRVLREAVETGKSMDAARSYLTLLPPTIPATLDLASSRADLPGALDTMGEMFQQQAEIRLRAIPLILTPLLVFLMAFLIGFVILALFMPLLKLFQVISGPF